MYYLFPGKKINAKMLDDSNQYFDKKTSMNLSRKNDNIHFSILSVIIVALVNKKTFIYIPFRFFHTRAGRGAFKGGLISERFSLCLKSPKNVSNHAPEHYLLRLGG